MKDETWKVELTENYLYSSVTVRTGPLNYVERQSHSFYFIEVQLASNLIVDE